MPHHTFETPQTVNRSEILCELLRISPLLILRAIAIVCLFFLAACLVCAIFIAIAYILGATLLGLSEWVTPGSVSDVLVGDHTAKLWAPFTLGSLFVLASTFLMAIFGLLKSWLVSNWSLAKDIAYRHKYRPTTTKEPHV